MIYRKERVISMTKKIIIVLAVLGAVCGAALVGCQVYEQELEVEEYPVEEVPDGYSNDAPVCYYGCPNSRRVKKLGLKKKRLK